MIISKIRGGLGNQLFQWASGFALAKLHDTELLLDTSTYNRNKARQFELSKLGCEVEIASDSQIHKLQDNFFYKQPVFHFDQNFIDLKNDSYIRGYFCSEKYFLDAALDIKSTLAPSLSLANLDSQQQDLLDLITNTNSVSLHIRRGDYTSNNSYNDFFGTCPLGYYEQAVNLLRDQLGNDIRFFVFSDDLEWASSNIKFHNSTSFSDVNRGESSYLDLLFMSQCKHNVIANSTFSWWAAWLNSNINKTVIAPKKWFQSNYREKSGKGVWIKSPHYDFSDIFPEDWVSI